MEDSLEHFARMCPSRALKHEPDHTPDKLRRRANRLKPLTEISVGCGKYAYLGVR